MWIIGNLLHFQSGSYNLSITSMKLIHFHVETIKVTIELIEPSKRNATIILFRKFSGMQVFHQIIIRKWKFKKLFCSQIRIQQIAFYSIFVSSSTRQQWTTNNKTKKTNHINLLLSPCKFFFFCRHCIFNRLIGTNAVMQKKNNNNE